MYSVEDRITPAKLFSEVMMEINENELGYLPKFKKIQVIDSFALYIGHPLGRL